ncbi:MAG: glutamate--tRNA ligase, partial [Candidatus Limnocylindria bacterium]
PKHIALIQALGYREPTFGHIPLILNPDRSKMSKRKSQTAISDYRAEGYLPEAMVNFLAFLGWSPGTEEEIFSLDELAARFEIGEVHKAGAVFDRDRLDHLNGVYIRSLTDADLALRLRPLLPEAISDATLAGLVPLVRERMVRLTDAVELSGFLAEPVDVVAGWWSVDDLLPKGRDVAEVAAALGVARDALVACGDWSAEELEAAARGASDSLGWKAGDFFRPIRLTVTGKAVSPPLFGSMVLLGRERTVARLEAALERLRAGALA